MKCHYPAYILSSLFIMLFFMPACAPVIKTVYGIKKPKYKSDAQVMKYANKIDLDGDIYRIRDFDGAHAGAFKLESIPTLYAFNHRNEQIDQTISCSSDYMDLVDLSVDSLNALSSKEGRFHDLMSRLYNVQSGYGLVHTGNQKPTFVILWASYIGRLNRDNALPWWEKLKNRDDVNVYLVNADINRVAKR